MKIHKIKRVFLYTLACINFLLLYKKGAVPSKEMGAEERNDSKTKMLYLLTNKKKSFCQLLKTVYIFYTYINT